MQYSLLFLSLIGAVTAVPQGVTEAIAPKEAPPSGCSLSYTGKFQITAVKAAAKRDLDARGDCGGAGSLTLTLVNGALTDSKGRIGSIVANRQFQFDGPPAQTGAIYTSGFAACSNGTLALGGSAVFYQCLSGSFYNLYDQSWAEQCSPVQLAILPCSGDSSSTGSPVAQIGDGQPQAASAAAISEKADGKPQVPTAVPAISQIGDGQIQAPNGPAITQLPNQTPSKAAPAPAKPVVTQIGDGQIQVPTAVNPAPVAPAASKPVAGAPISQIGDGQVQVGTATPVQPAAPVFTGAAAVFQVGGELAAFVAGVAAIGLL